MSCTFVWSLNRSIVPRPENRSPRSSVSHHKNACVALFDGSQSEREGLSSWGASRASILREKRCKGPRQDARIFTSPHLAAADRRCLSRVSVPLLPDTQSRRLMAAQAHFVISARVRHTTLAGLRAARKYSNSGPLARKPSYCPRRLKKTGQAMFGGFRLWSRSVSGFGRPLAAAHHISNFPPNLTCETTPMPIRWTNIPAAIPA